MKPTQPLPADLLCTPVMIAIKATLRSATERLTRETA